MNDLDDFMGALSKKRSQYTMEEIDKAAKKARKAGGGFLDILQETTGKSLKANESLNQGLDEISTMAGTMQQELNKKLKKLNQAVQEDTDIKPENMNVDLDSVAADLKDLDAHLQQDFGIFKDQSKDASLSDSVENQAAKIDADSFQGLKEKVAESVFGQDEFIKKLVVAFKRPFVLPEEKNHARNSFYVCGPAKTGRHLAIKKMAEEMSVRGIISDPEIMFMDLSIYTASGKDNVFLQDLYSALQSKGQIIIFENLNACHISYLGYLGDLVIHGECRLQDRYILQRGQLVNVSNSFASQTVSTFQASGKYLIFLSEKNVDSLADTMGAPFINALGDVCTSCALMEDDYRKIAEVQWKELTQKAEKQLGFVIKAEENMIFDQAVAAASGRSGTAGLLTFFSNLEKSLATLKLEGDYEKGTNVELTLEESCLYALINDQKTDLMANLPQAYTGALDAVKAELDSIVGLTKVKEYILSLEEYYHTQKRRTEAGLKASEVSKHMIFTGNPGTGKTTIARIVSRYLKAIGVLTGGQLVEVSRADLVGRYVGHTAPLVNQVIRSALGGVLFIDEAYSLYRGKEDSFGLEAIDTLVKGIEDNRDNLIVILAGYSREMMEFLEANSGLKSRFPNFIDFPDYTGEELLAITKITVKSKGYVLDEGTEDVLLSYYNAVQALRADTAGNGRLVRNKVEEAILNQSRRLVAEPDADLSTLTTRDFQLDDVNG